MDLKINLEIFLVESVSKFWQSVVFFVEFLMVLYVSSLISSRFSRVR